MMENFNSLALEGKEVMLRTVRLSDANELFRIITDSREHLERWLPWVDFVRSADDERHIVEQWLYEMQMKSAIHLCMNVESQIAGIISAHRIDWMNERASIGYWTKRDMTGRHIATGSAAVLTKYIFEELRLHRIYIQAATDNMPSNRVIQRLGFKLEGTLREDERIRDRFVDLNIYGMTVDDFEKTKENLSPYFAKQ